MLTSEQLGRSSEPLHTENPWSNYVAGERYRFEDLQLDGEAEVPTQEWAGWLERGGAGEEPGEKTRGMSFQEIARRGAGWKLHLNFDAEDSFKTQMTSSLLDSLQDNEAIQDFKIGHGGGTASDAPGKEATVYIGSRNKGNVVARILEEALAGTLEEPEGDTLNHDVYFTGHVMGRFDIGRVDPEFHQYGPNGVPLLKSDQLQIIYGGDIEEAQTRADTVLRERYGEFYTGTE